MKTIDTIKTNPKNPDTEESPTTGLYRSFWVLLCCLTFFLSPSLGQTGSFIRADKSDYLAGEHVNISGQDFQPGTSVRLKILKLDLNQEENYLLNVDDKGEILFSDFIVTDANVEYEVQAISEGPFYDNISTTSFTNTSGLFQSHNGGVNAAPVSPVEWVKGNAHGGNSHYLEGHSIPYRMVLRDVAPGSHQLLIGFDTRDGAKTAIDFMTSNNRINEIVNPTIDLEGTFSGPTYCSSPAPVNNVLVTGYEGAQMQPISCFNKLKPNEKRIAGYNAILDSAIYMEGGSFTDAHSEARIMIYFHTVTDIKDVVISWGGHISSRLDWGPVNSAAAINGSPYHTRLISFDGVGGNQDRSLKTDAVIFVPSCGVQGAALVCGGGNYQYTASTNAPIPSYNWQVTGNAVIVGSSTNSTVNIQPSAAGSYTVSVVIIDNTGGVQSAPSGDCSAFAQIIVNPIIGAGVDQANCADDGSQFTLNGSASSGSVLWEVISGTANIANPSQLNSSVELTSPTATLRLSAVDACEVIYDDVILTLNDIEDVSILGDDNNCLSLSTVLSSSLQGDYTYAWSIEGDASITSALDLASVDVNANNACDVSYTVSLLVTDNQTNCQSDTSRFISFNDSIVPVLSGQGADGIIACTEDPVFTPPTALDNCDLEPSVVEVSDVTTPGDCANEYSRTVTWKAVDACGNESDPVSQTIQSVDTLAPVLSGQGADGIIACTEDPVFTPPTALDNCDENPAVIEVSDVTTPGDCANEYSRTVTWKAVDACGNESDPVSQTIQSVDTLAPVLSGQGADGIIACTEDPVFTPPTALDNCDENPAVIEVSDVTTPGDCANEYSRTVTWKAVDACGNESDPVSQTIQSVDTLAPVLSGQGADGIIACTEDPVFTPPTALDNCDENPAVIEVSDVTTPGDCANEYSRTVTWKAVDACGNESDPVSQTIQSVDTLAPVLSGQGADGIIACTEDPVFTPPTALDNCDENPAVIEVSDVTTPGDCANEYSRTVTWKAVDACGNESDPVSQTIQSVDTLAPVLSGQGADGIIACTEDPVFTPPTALDNCDENPAVIEVSDVTTPGDCANEYSRTVTWKAVDACGNESDPVSQTIQSVDTLAPVLSGQGADGIIACTEDPVFTPPTALDNCDENPAVIEVSDVTTPGDCANEYSRTVTWKAVDACGNESDPVSQTIQSVDTLAPVLSGQGADGIIACTEDPVFTPPTALDNCDENPAVIEVSDVTTPGDCANEYSRTVTWKAVDACGNESDPVSQTIQSVDTLAPVLSGQGADGIIACTEDPVFTPPTALDNCDLEPQVVEVSDVTTPGDCANEYSRTVTWKAVDACGNESDPVSQTIQSVDTLAPVLSGQGADGIIACTEDPVFTPPTALDNCDLEPQVVEVSDVTTPGDCANEYSRTVTWKAVDACGNESDPVSQTIQVIDDLAPVLSGQGADGIIECPAIPEFTAPTAIDNCDENPEVVLIYDEITPYDCPNTYLHVKSWVAVDACGNYSDTLTQQIMVVDETPPTISSAGPNLVLACHEELVFTPPTGDDACSEVEIVEVSRDTLDLGNGTLQYTVTWKAVDACGNESDEVGQTIEQTCFDPIFGCSLTQGFYGNAKGKACATGERGTDLMYRLLGPDFGDLVIGVQGRSLTIEQSDLTCLIAKLPAGGTPAKLPLGSNGLNANCITGTSLDNKPKFNNVLLGQVITLGLNLRLDTELGDIQLEGTEMTTYGLIAVEDGLCGTEDDIVNEASIVTKQIPQSVLDALASQYNGDRSIYNLYQLANRVIGGEIIAGVSLSDVNGAVSSMNEGFDECRALVGFENRQFGGFDNPDVFSSFKYEVFPNPFAEKSTLAFVSEETAFVKVELYSATGQIVEVLFNDYIDSETIYNAPIDGNKLINGVYFCKITVDGEVHMTRVLLNK